MTKTTLYLLMILPLIALLHKLQAKLQMQAPVGYQDEDGFHLGTPTGGDKKWPPFW